MNAASIESSERLNRVLDLLSQGGEFTTWTSSSQPTYAR